MTRKLCGNSARYEATALAIAFVLVSRTESDCLGYCLRPRIPHRNRPASSPALPTGRGRSAAATASGWRVAAAQINEQQFHREVALQPPRLERQVGLQQPVIGGH